MLPALLRTVTDAVPVRCSSWVSVSDVAIAALALFFLSLLPVSRRCSLVQWRITYAYLHAVRQPPARSQAATYAPLHSGAQSLALARSLTVSHTCLHIVSRSF